MIEWLGGEQNVVGLLIPLVGIFVLWIAPKITNTGPGRRYFLLACISFFGFQVVIGLEQGTLISFPHPVGMISGILLLIGFGGFCFRGLFAEWKERKSSTSQCNITI